MLLFVLPVTPRSEQQSGRREREGKGREGKRPKHAHFSFCNLLLPGPFHSLILQQSTFPSPCFWLSTSRHYPLVLPLAIPWNTIPSSLRTFLAYSHLTYHTEHSFLTSHKVVMLTKKGTRLSTKSLYAACYTHCMPTHCGAAPSEWPSLKLSSLLF